MELKDAQKSTDELINQMGGYWPPLAMLASIVEEIGELAREINALEHHKPKKATEVVTPIGEELADTLFSLICVANYYKVDLGKEFLSVIEKYRIRDAGRFSPKKSA
jgi:NTP pyrophosphatase (non-canonical NTP hydrolase)